MDYIDTKDLSEIAVEINKSARQLKDKLVEQAKLKCATDKALSMKMDSLIEKKKNIGIETAIILSIKDDAEFEKTYSNYTICKAECDGLKIMIESLTTQVMLSQSLMKFTQKEGG